MVRGSYCQLVMTFFLVFKLQFQSGTSLFKSLDPPLFTQHESNTQNVVSLARD